MKEERLSLSYSILIIYLNATRRLIYEKQEEFEIVNIKCYIFQLAFVTRIFALCDVCVCVFFKCLYIHTNNVQFMTDTLAHHF